MLLTSFYTYKKPHKDLPKPLAAFPFVDQVVPTAESSSKASSDETKDKGVVASEEPVKQVDQVDTQVEEPDKPVDQPNQPADQPEKPDEETVKPTDHPDKPTDQLDEPVDENTTVEPENPTVDLPDKPVDQLDKPVDETVKPVDQLDKPVEAKETDKAQTAPASETPPPAAPPPSIPPRNQKPHTDVTDLAILVRKILSVSEKVASVVSELKKQEGSYGRQGSVGTPIAESAPTSFDFYMKAMKPLQFGKCG